MTAGKMSSILIVEDEAFIRMVAADILEDAGLTTLQAGDADEALELIEKHPEIGLLFTDIDMPGPMNGMDLADRVHKMHPDIALVVTSGNRRVADAELADHGVFLPKPYHAANLTRIIGRQLGRVT